jgi:hypothetical protein
MRIHADAVADVRHCFWLGPGELDDKINQVKSAVIGVLPL